MRCPQMCAAGGFLLAMAPVAGISESLGNSQQAWLIAIGILLGAAAVALATVGARSRRKNQSPERRAAGEKISNSLVVLSSAAILAVYAAGYQRTSSAWHQFELQAERRKAAAAIASVAAPPAASPAVGTTPAVPRSPAQPPKKDAARPTAPVKKATPAPGEDSVATPSAPPVAAAAPAPAPAIQYKDGTYLGWGTSRHGDIQAAVVIEGGRIASAAIAQCLTRYSCTWISPRTPGTGLPEFDLPGQVVIRQSAKVDFVSGATESSEAYSDAVSEALSKAHE
jgi:uncharacterized protein with FMN-binding domain